MFEGINLGRPFEGRQWYFGIIEIYNEYNSICPNSIVTWGDKLPHPLIKKGDSFEGLVYFDMRLNKELVPGLYDLKVTAYGCSQIYEDLIIVK